MIKRVLVLFLLSSLMGQAEEKIRTNKTVKHKVKKSLKKGIEKPKKITKDKNYVTTHNLAFVLSSSLVGRNILNSEYKSYGIDGFVRETAFVPIHQSRGFNLNYAELAGHVDMGDFFEAQMLFHIHPDDFEPDEAFVATRNLPSHLIFKAGVFMSSFGRINALHPDEQHFTTLPLVYQAMLGLEEKINDAGLGMQWVAPTENYLTIGTEVFHARNSLSFSDKKEMISVAYLKNGFQVAEDTSLLWGGSVADGKTESGASSRLYGTELSVKYDLSEKRKILWQSEYLFRERDGSKQEGFYTQALYDLNTEWGFGGRYDALTRNIADASDYLSSYSLIASYKFNKAARLRLQYNLDNSKSFGGERKENQELILEFIMMVGDYDAHAH